MRGQRSVFYQRHISSTIFHARANWLQYQINLVTRVLVDFQQKINLTLNNWLDPQIVFVFSDCTRYATWCLFYVVYYFCAGNIFIHGNPIESNKCKNHRDESNHNINDYNIEHLPFEMVYQYYQQLHSTGIKGAYKIPTPDKVICVFLMVCF